MEGSSSSRAALVLKRLADQVAIILGHSHPPGNICDDEFSISGTRVTWSRGGAVTKCFTTKSPVIQVAWCRFEESKSLALCLLQADALTTYAEDGDANTIPLRDNFTQMWPLPNGLLLAGSADSGPRLLLHPLEDLLHVPLELGASVAASSSHDGPRWAAERIIWAGTDAPFMLTYNRADQLVQLWRIKAMGKARGPEANGGGHPFRTPQARLMRDNGPPGSAASGSGVKRPSMRLADGSLSPAAFSPKPRAAAQAAGPPPSRLLATPQVPFVVSLIWEQQVPEGRCPEEGHLATDADGSPLLALLNRQSRRATILRLPPVDGNPGTLEVVAEVDAIAVATLTSTRPLTMHSGRCSAVEETRPAKDILVLHPGGRLTLFVGSRQLCNVRFPAQLPKLWVPSTPVAKTVPAAASQGARQEPQASEPMNGSPGSDCSMACSDGGDQETPMAMKSPESQNVSGPDVKALADALDSPPEIADLKDARGERVTLVLKDGSSWRVSLPFAPQGPLPKLALDALAQVLPALTFQRFYSHFLTAPGSAGQDGDQQWASFAELLLAWAADASVLDAAAPVGLHSDSGITSSEGMLSPTPGSIDSASSAAWEALLQSDHHRTAVAAGTYWWLPRPAGKLPEGLGRVASAPGRQELWHVLAVLHALYEDFKLHTLRWHLLPRLGKLLSSLAIMLGATAYTSFYQREFGPPRLPEGPTGPHSSSQSVDAASVPADVHRALHSLLGNSSPDPWLPPALGNQPSFLRRSVDVLHFYRAFAESAGKCLPLLAESVSDQDGALSSESMYAARQTVLEGAQKLVLAMVDRGWCLADVDTLPVGVALPLREAMFRCRAHPPAGWPMEAFVLVGREDIACTMAAAAGAPPVQEASGSDTVAQPASGAWDGTLSRSRPALAVRTPLRQPQLRTPAPGAARSRLSLGGEAPIIAAAAAAAVAAPVPIAQEPRTPSGRRHSELVLPYSQRLQIPGLDWEEEEPEAEMKLSGSDGMEGTTEGPSKLRFGRDLRLLEVRKLLQSAIPAVVRTKNAPEVSETESGTAQQARLMAVAVRTMALPVGRAAFSLGTLRPLPTEPLEIPKLNLSGRLPQQQNAVISLDLSNAATAPGGGAAADFTAWPEFHNGVAAGLRLAPGGVQLTRTWIVYNKPKTPSYAHAGMLMGLGLTGHLSCLAATDLYRYLSQEHDATTAGVLLGMAAAKRGTLDPTISKMLFLHVPTRHPSTYPELELSPLVQSAALLGVGLLYQGSCHRLTAEIMLEEIGRLPGTVTGPSSSGNNNADATQVQSAASVATDREGYALAAGLALGLICLGRGHQAQGLADLGIEARLRHYMLGGANSRFGKGLFSRAEQPNTFPAGTVPAFEQGAIGFDPTLGGEPSWSQPGISPRGRGPAGSLQGQQGGSQVVLEGSVVNLDVTSPGATLALGLMFLRTNDAAVAAGFNIPDTHYALDYVRPDFIQMRVLARALVMWDSVLPTEQWLQSQLPDIIKGPISKFSQQPAASGSPLEDPEAVAQAHIYAVSGACLGMGIRYAGTGSESARAVLHHYVTYFFHAKLQAPDPSQGAAAVWGKLDKQVLENCMGVVAIALSLVMAGSGHLPTLRLLQGLRKRLSQGPNHTVGAVFYGNHMAVSMALGFLFYGAGTRTFGTSNAAVAALVVSLFPRFPLSPTDHRCHLQAFRHLHVLASEPRCLDAVDVDTRESVYVPLQISLREPPGPPGSNGRNVVISRTTPCLLPEQSQVKDIRVAGPRYWQQRVSQDGSGSACLRDLYQSGVIFVQRKAGALSYSDDPTGVRSLLSKAFHQGPGANLKADRHELADLCAAFGMDPSVMAFAQHFCASGSAFTENNSQEPAAPLTEFRTFCRSILYECITQEKASALQSYLFFFSLVQSFISKATVSSASGVENQAALCGGPQSAVALWNLNLGLAFYDSAISATTARLAAAAAPEESDGEEQETWESLLQPRFLQGLWIQLGQHGLLAQ